MMHAKQVFVRVDLLSLLQEGGVGGNKARYEYDDRTRFTMECKLAICKILQKVLHIALDVQIGKFVLAFKSGQFDVPATLTPGSLLKRLATSTKRLYVNACYVPVRKDLHMFSPCTCWLAAAPVYFEASWRKHMHAITVLLRVRHSVAI